MKPWPRDVLVIVAEPFGRHKAENMEWVLLRFCRDCRCLVAGDSASYRSAMTMPARMGREIIYLCTRCAGGYRIMDCQEIHDNAGVLGPPNTVWVDPSKGDPQCN